MTTTQVSAANGLAQGGPDGRSAPPGLLRAVAIGAAVGVVAAFVFVGGGMLLAGFADTASLAVGGMAAFWGGLGFGSMFGGVMFLTRHEEL